MVALSPKARIRPLAATDLEDAVCYLDQHSEAAADRFLEEFYQACSLLAERPRLGPVRRRRGRLKGLRSWPLTQFGPYVIFYRPIEDGIDVVRVLHGARDVDRCGSPSSGAVVRRGWTIASLPLSYPPQFFADNGTVFTEIRHVRPARR